MSGRYGPVLYPSSYFGVFTSTLLSDTFERLTTYYTNAARGKLFTFELSLSASVLVKISSRIGADRGWKRAGYFVQSLRGTPIASPRKQVERVYLDNQYFSFTGDGFSYYFEFWPHTWLTDYQIEIWAKQLPDVFSDANEQETGLILFGVGDSLPTEEFTFFGDLIVFP